MKTLSTELRKRIVDAYERGEGSRRRFAVAKATVESHLARYRTTGSVAPKTYRHGPARRVADADYPMIEAWITADPDLTQQQIADRFAAETGRPVSQRTISRVLRRMGMSRKKEYEGF